MALGTGDGTGAFRPSPSRAARSRSRPGKAASDADRLVLAAERGQTEYGICSTAFLEYAFRTDRYHIEVTFHDDGSWSYVLHTTLIVRGRSEPFDHRDENRLVKVGEPSPNPLMRILAARAAAEARD